LVVAIATLGSGGGDASSTSRRRTQAAARRRRGNERESREIVARRAARAVEGERRCRLMAVVAAGECVKLRVASTSGPGASSGIRLGARDVPVEGASEEVVRPSGAVVAGELPCTPQEPTTADA